MVRDVRQDRFGRRRGLADADEEATLQQRRDEPADFLLEIHGARSLPVMKNRAAGVAA
jgi:hypothetical protein